MFNIHNFLKIISVLLVLTLVNCSKKISTMPDFRIPFESDPNRTLTYPEIISCYEKMAAAHPGIFHFEATGSTDSGEPLHVGVLSTDGVFDPEKIRQSGRCILLINNGIHPGEPEGIDATILLLRDMLTQAAWRPVLRLSRKPMRRVSSISSMPAE